MFRVSKFARLESINACLISNDVSHWPFYSSTNEERETSDDDAVILAGKFSWTSRKKKLDRFGLQAVDTKVIDLFYKTWTTTTQRWAHGRGPNCAAAFLIQAYSWLTLWPLLKSDELIFKKPLSTFQMCLFKSSIEISKI